MRIPHLKIQEILLQKLLLLGFREAKAEMLSKTFMESSLDGVYSHGLNRFPRFHKNVKQGYVHPNAEPEKISSSANLEQWDGNLGPGIYNATRCMSRAMEIAGDAGIGCVALSNTNHWMRGGTYGWQAAENGFIGICWTNTAPNMVAWGSKSALLGNNPLVIAIPREEGHVVLDMAMSQYSYGKMHTLEINNKMLEFPGGLDHSGHLTRDPAIIMETEKAIPMGFWKGSALSIVLDMLAAILSSGKATHSIGMESEEYRLSQVFIAIHTQWLDPKLRDATINDIIRNIHTAEPAKEGDRTYYPGERILLTRKENLKSGIPVNKDIWNTILNL